jgi:hypothetical protein
MIVAVIADLALTAAVTVLLIRHPILSEMDTRPSH